MEKHNQSMLAKNTNHNVMALATAKSYDLVLNTCVTAHPAAAPYPRWNPDYVVPVRKGGVLEHIYTVQKIIECLPEQINELQNELPNSQYQALASYHKMRKSSFGYAKTGENYRFYILKPYADILQPYVKKYIQVSKKIDLSEIPLVR